MQSAPIKDEILKSYIEQIFSRYDSNSSGTLNPTEMTNFFNDLFQSLNIPLVLNTTQSIETIKAVNPSYNGTVTRDELFSTFKVLLGYESMPVQQQPVQQPSNMPQNYGQYQMMQNGGYMAMPNFVNVGSNIAYNLDGFVPQQGYMMNPNMLRQGQQQYPNGFVQGFATGYPNMSNMNGQQFTNFRRQ